MSANRIVCKVCEISKHDEDSHWKLISLELSGFIGGFFCTEWDEIEADSPWVEFACGEQHALILFERWLATKSFDPGPQVSGPIEPIQGEQHEHRNSEV